MKMFWEVGDEDGVTVSRYEDNNFAAPVAFVGSSASSCFCVQLIVLTREGKGCLVFGCFLV